MLTRTKFLASTLITNITLAVYDPGKAGWKMTADGKAMELKDGNPIWVSEDGTERTIEGGVITRLNGEARELRTRAENAEKAMLPFKDIDPVAAKKAMDTVKNIDAKKLIDAGEVEKVRNEISASFTQQMGEKDKALNDTRSELDSLKIDNIFAMSEFVRDRVAVPADMFQASFRQNFKIKDGKVEAYDRNGNRLMSKRNTGDYADPSEAIEILVDQHPQKATILKASDHGGSGNNGGGGGRNQGRTMRRADYDKLNGIEQARIAGQAGKGEITLID